MCGIVAGVSDRDIVPVLVKGLERLEYRGYDSCGIAIQHEGGLQRARSTERIQELKQQVTEIKMIATAGIAHTRWATHGAPVTDNAHPHFSFSPASAQPLQARMAVVHNGIIENYEALRTSLIKQGYAFTSQTDTEVIVNLVDSLYQGDLLTAVQQACKQVRGTYAIALICLDEPGRVVGARQGSPLVVGVGDKEKFLASDALALAGEVKEIVYLDDGDFVDMRADKYRLIDQAGQAVQRKSYAAQNYAQAIDLGPYRHYMQKEIFEQPNSIADTLDGIVSMTPNLFGADAKDVFEHIDSILILACGTSYYAGLVASYWLEDIARVPTRVEVASEYRYRHSIPDPRTLVIVISQSGETADTLSALRHAQSQGLKNTLTICNVATSTMVRECKLTYITRAGVEVGVASTKAFTAQLSGLFLLTLTLAKMKGLLSAESETQYINSMRAMPTMLKAVLALEPQIIAWADKLAHKENALFLGRNLLYPVALEGALKLKEITYMHAQGYPAGELKHGPLALIADGVPVVIVAPNDELFEKMKSNIQEVRARGGELFVFADADADIESEPSLHIIRLPGNYQQLAPMMYVVALQLLAYHTACARGTDVDKPRNLAKSVTV
ncbi:MAG: glutamine--fructose-6-phosphate transaminase (isomerizing), partial [Saezia sp.]